MNKKLLAVIIAIAIIATLLICLFIILSVNENKDVDEQKNTSIATTASVSSSEETSPAFYDDTDDEEFDYTNINANVEYDDTQFSGRIPQIFDSKYAKVWKSEDGKITFTNINKLGLYGRGEYEGIFEDNLQKEKIDIALEDYRLLIPKKKDRDDGSLVMFKTIFENGDYVGTVVLGGFYIADEKNNKFTVTIDTVRNKHLKTGYKKGDKIVFYQIDE